MSNPNPAANTRISTRDRILEISLKMFNEQGERNVSTNHIAAELKMSPGNLYYHFSNKQAIIRALFERHYILMQDALVVPDRALTWLDKMNYFEGIFQNMWSSRYFHRDLEHMLSQDDELKTQYSALAKELMLQAYKVYEGLQEAGLIQANEEQIKSMIVNAWVIITSWTSFLHTTAMYTDNDSMISEAMLRHGIYQLICIEEPYLCGEALQYLDKLKAQFLKDSTASPFDVVAGTAL